MDFEKWKEENKDLLEDLNNKDILLMYLENEFDLTEFEENETIKTVEQVRMENYGALEMEELKDIKDNILETIKALEKYKDRGLYVMTMMDLFGLEYVVCDVNYNYISKIAL
ncbi:MAG: hypothetical protein E6929_11675 [Clostridium sp.]|nr:hypothetical protein [Clostridium sp.]